ncbi:S8/S53 family peptidase [Halospina sp. K52047b]|uniref:S8/S53 family peptidase n=1 Tax=Halospina sp. K52047b TaxID=2614160 RepID=UPI00124A22D0|nr:S8/S53 family peptidase [Halospina sp. K52047b]KAA8985168.1 S8/S53 family peptidase [Halospina sp. K52047b]
MRVQGPEDGHRWMSETSFSAPIVSGILGLIAQDIPELEKDTLLDLLPGAGILNAARLQAPARCR